MKAGKLRVLAVGSSGAVASQLPNVPTLDELGLKGFDADAVFGIYAPAGTSPDIIARLNKEINRYLATPIHEDRIAIAGQHRRHSMSPDGFFSGEIAERPRSLRHNHTGARHNGRQLDTQERATTLSIQDPSPLSGLRSPCGLLEERIGAIAGSLFLGSKWLPSQPSASPLGFAATRSASTKFRIAARRVNRPGWHGDINRPDETAVVTDCGRNCRNTGVNSSCNKQKPVDLMVRISCFSCVLERIVWGVAAVSL